MESFDLIESREGAFDGRVIHCLVTRANSQTGLTAEWHFSTSFRAR